MDRIQEIDPLVHGLVDQRFEDALQDAKEVDRLIQSTPENIQHIFKERPLLGVPFTVKDCVAVTGNDTSSSDANDKPKQLQFCHAMSNVNGFCYRFAR